MENRFGTTSDMIIQDVEENGVPLLLALDAQGLYLTSRTYLDKGRADPNRYTGARHDVRTRLSALGLDPVALLNDNKHLVRTDTGKAARKVNPLKASKRNARSA